MLITSKNKVSNEGFYLFILFAVLVVSSVWWSSRLAKESNAVVYSSDAGVVISATYSESSFGAYLTQIETTKSTFRVQGTLALNEGERLTLEKRGNGDNMLCKVSQKDCRSLID